MTPLPRRFLALVSFLSLHVVANGAVPAPLAWRQLPPLPDREGFAGSYAGASNGDLIVAGGANFPDRRPWEGGTKTWYDHVFVLAAENGAWRRSDPLPRAGGYGVSVNLSEGAVFIGGGDAARNFNDVWLVRSEAGRVTFTAWPALPRPLALMAGAAAGRKIYVAGGQTTPTATQAERIFLLLDADRLNEGWQILPAWPGAARIFPAVGTADGAVYLFGGAALKADAAGKATREWLRDAYRYDPANGWRRIADLPRVAVAAPSPAPRHGGELLVLGGDDGAQVAVAPTAHRGFPRDMLAFDSATEQWRRAGEMPFSLVTTTLTTWRGRIVIPGGEARPGVRSTQVWATEATAGVEK